MIRDRRTWEAFEAEWQRRNPPDLEVHFRIFDRMLELARALHAWPPADPLEGLEVDLQLARAINADVRLSAE
jgi:hypothetical protein